MKCVMGTVENFRTKTSVKSHNRHAKINLKCRLDMKSPFCKAESHYNIYDRSAVDYVSHAHCIVFCWE